MRTPNGRDLTELQRAFRAQSPRLNPRSANLAGVLLYTAIVAIWLLALAAAFGANGLLAWSAGLIYVAYDTTLLVFVAIEMRSLWRARPEPAAPVVGPSIGVIVAAYNEAASIAATIEALHAQTDPPERIWIADDGSNDETVERMRQLYRLAAPIVGEASPPSPVAPALRWLRLPHHGKAAALNAALEIADTDVVLTVDADTQLRADALAEIRAAFAADPGLVVGGGVLTPRGGAGLTARMLEQFQVYEYVRNFLARHAWSRLESLLLISGAFAAFRTDAVRRVGGFDTASWVEDYELIHRIHRFGVDHGLDWRVRILGRARASTDAPASIPAFLRQRRRWFAGFLQTQWWNRDMIAERRFGWLGLAMMPVKAMDTLQPLYGLAASALLLTLLAQGRFDVLLPASMLVLGKIVLDMANGALSIFAYRRWTGATGEVRLSRALGLLIAEPFTFQLLRHLGATLGWVAIARGSLNWGRSSRQGAPTATRAKAAAEREAA